MNDRNAQNPRQMWKILLVAIIEASYAIFTRTWLRNHAGLIEVELWTSVARVASLIAYSLLFRDLLLSREANYSPLPHPLFALSIVLVLLVPLLFGRWDLPRPTAPLVFAVTSVIVAIREEILYRGVLQNLFQTRLRWPEALLLSNLVFLLFHYGAVQFTLYVLIEIFAMGWILGLIYIRTGSLWPGIFLHAAYDAIYAFAPFIAYPLDNRWRIPFHLAGLMLAVLWFQRSNTLKSKG